jgi:hypothetical protein
MKASVFVPVHTINWGTIMSDAPSTSLLKFHKFRAAYVECMLWAENDQADEQGGEPLENNYEYDSLTPDSKYRIDRVCMGFWSNFKEFFYDNPEQAGHDFWLTRQGHGTGFWDRPEIYGEYEAEWLTKVCRVLGEATIYVGDDGCLHYE